MTNPMAPGRQRRAREYYLERKEKGLCVTCGKPNDREFIRCSSCYEKRKKWYKDNKNKVKIQRER
jgi:predicted amidophosphoribosyltransferase